MSQRVSGNVDLLGGRRSFDACADDGRVVLGLRTSLMT